MSRFLRSAAIGMLGGVLAFAAFNSLSYFVRTGGNLQRHGGRIGFPWLVWADNGCFGRDFYLNALLADVGIGLAASGAIGCLFALAVRGDRKVSGSLFPAPPRNEDVEESAAKLRRPQFSLLGLMLLVTSVAVLFALGQEAEVRVKRQMLILAYWLGPGLLAASHGLASWLAPRARGQTMLIVAPLVLLAPLVLGPSAGLKDSTLVALGFFIYWTPQCVLLLALFCAWGLVHPDGESRASRAGRKAP
ncbi:MAG TPA: hypothetical protein VMV10_17005 [Pirellulales bacterium]|nr:hypothetical protein [Pirellulales bacterium]